jgi:hypothetical protein
VHGEKFQHASKSRKQNNCYPCLLSMNFTTSNKIILNKKGNPLFRELPENFNLLKLNLNPILRLRSILPQNEELFNYKSLSSKSVVTSACCDYALAIPAQFYIP